MSRFHSVRLVEDKCRGCTACLKRCPVEAIRVYDKKAHILDERCIDCGECIRVCEYHAKVALTDSLESIRRFAFPVALVAPSLYGQFRQPAFPETVHRGLMELGFSMVFDVARGADLVARAVREELKKEGPRPLLSTACPAVTRLVQARFPSLLSHLVPLRQPMEAAAAMARRQAREDYGAKPEDIGVFFLTPCPAKMTAIQNPLGHEASLVDGAISMMDIFSLLQPKLPKEGGADLIERPTREGLRWAAAGGEIKAVRPRNSIAVDGIDHVIQVLEEVETRGITGLDYIEALACQGGCIGGPLVYENAYLARNTLERVLGEMASSHFPDGWEFLEDEALFAAQPIPENGSMKLHESISGAIERMEEMNSVLESLPGYDCGSCGSPTCASFAEDIVRGLFTRNDCIYVLKDTLKDLAQSMVDLAKTRRE